jgi:hypothetical protein
MDNARAAVSGDLKLRDHRRITPKELRKLPEPLRAAVRSFERDVERVLKGFLLKVEQSTPPPLLYHYTNAAGLLGILQSGCLWFTNAFQLNDPSEITHGIQGAIELLAERITSNEVDRFGLIYNEFAEAFRYREELAFRDIRTIVEELARLFVCSFSREGDDLGQWRAYGDDGRGFALFFDGALIENAFGRNSSGHLAFPVNYDEIELERLVNIIVERVAIAIDPALCRGFGEEELYLYLRALHESFTFFVMRASIFFKHPGYRSEAEYRLLQVLRAEASPETLKLRARPYALVQYREFNWRDSAPDSLRGVVMGPTADFDKASEFVWECMRNANIDRYEIKRSKIPYSRM